jgi:hypothetical protein
MKTPRAFLMRWKLKVRFPLVYFCNTHKAALTEDISLWALNDNEDNLYEKEQNMMNPSPPPKQQAFKIGFDVPYGKAACDLNVSSNIRFADFLQDLTDAMGLRATALQVGYVLYFLPRSPKPKPKVLDSKKGWNTLICDIATWIEGEKGKNRGGCVVEPWHVHIGDLVPVQEKATSGKTNVSTYLRFPRIYYLFIYYLLFFPKLVLLVWLWDFLGLMVQENLWLKSHPFS